MSPRNPDTPELTPEARRQLLLVACTIDRVSLLAKSRRIHAVGRGPLVANAAPWISMATALIPRLLPPKLRILTTLWQLWKRR